MEKLKKQYILEKKELDEIISGRADDKLEEISQKIDKYDTYIHKKLINAF